VFPVTIAGSTGGIPFSKKVISSGLRGSSSNSKVWGSRAEATEVIPKLTPTATRLETIASRSLDSFLDWGIKKIMKDWGLQDINAELAELDEGQMIIQIFGLTQ
jgi:hypothetical protein